MLLTRRRFVKRVAAAGGISLAYEAMTGLGLLATPSQIPFNLSGRVAGVRVFTARRGTVSEEDGASQTAAFDEGSTSMPDRCGSRTARRNKRVEQRTILTGAPLPFTANRYVRTWRDGARDRLAAYRTP